MAVYSRSFFVKTAFGIVLYGYDFRYLGSRHSYYNFFLILPMRRKTVIKMAIINMSLENLSFFS